MARRKPRTSETATRSAGAATTTTRVSRSQVRSGNAAGSRNKVPPPPSLDSPEQEEQRDDDGDDEAANEPNASRDDDRDAACVDATGDSLSNTRPSACATPTVDNKTVTAAMPATVDQPPTTALKSESDSCNTEDKVLSVQPHEVLKNDGDLPTNEDEIDAPESPDEQRVSSAASNRRSGGAKGKKRRSKILNKFAKFTVCKQSNRSVTQTEVTEEEQVASSPTPTPSTSPLPVTNQQGHFKCPSCELVVETQTEFTRHIRQHNVPEASSSATHTCSLCNKALSSASSLDRHMLVHSGERPFKCSTCGMAFTTNGNMHRHMRTHHDSPSSLVAGRGSGGVASHSDGDDEEDNMPLRISISSLVGKASTSPRAPAKRRAAPRSTSSKSLGTKRRSAPAATSEPTDGDDLVPEVENDHPSDEDEDIPIENELPEDDAAATTDRKTVIAPKNSGGEKSVKSKHSSKTKGAEEAVGEKEPQSKTVSGAKRKRPSLFSRFLSPEASRKRSPSREDGDAESDDPNNNVNGVGMRSNSAMNSLASPSSAADADGTLHCPVCNKTFLCKVGLQNHLESHPISERRRAQLGEEEESSWLSGSNGIGRDSDATFASAPATVGFHDLTDVDFSSRNYPLFAKSRCEKSVRRPSSDVHRFQCRLCKKAFPCKISLRMHIRTAHVTARVLSAARQPNNNNNNESTTTANSVATRRPAVAVANKYGVTRPAKRFTATALAVRSLSHGASAASCRLCHADFPDFRKLEQHMLRHRTAEQCVTPYSVAHVVVVNGNGKMAPSATSPTIAEHGPAAADLAPPQLNKENFLALFELQSKTKDASYVAPPPPTVQVTANAATNGLDLSPRSFKLKRNSSAIYNEEESNATQKRLKSTWNRSTEDGETAEKRSDDFADIKSILAVTSNSGLLPFGNHQQRHAVVTPPPSESPTSPRQEHEVARSPEVPAGHPLEDKDGEDDDDDDDTPPPPLLAAPGVDHRHRRRRTPSASSVSPPSISHHSEESPMKLQDGSPFKDSDGHSKLVIDDDPAASGPDDDSKAAVYSSDDAVAGPSSGSRGAGRGSRFECILCQQVLPNLRALKAHNRIHLGACGPPFLCNVCPYKSSDKSTLLRHLRTHNGERPFICTICQYAFTTKANCERHIRTKHHRQDKTDIASAMRHVSPSGEETSMEVDAPDASGNGNVAVVSPSSSEPLPAPALAPTASVLLPCPHCRLTFGDLRLHTLHLQSEHAELYALRVEPPPPTAVHVPSSVTLPPLSLHIAEDAHLPRRPGKNQQMHGQRRHQHHHHNRQEPVFPGIVAIASLPPASPIANRAMLAASQQYQPPTNMAVPPLLSLATSGQRFFEPSAGALDLASSGVQSQHSSSSYSVESQSPVLDLSAATELASRQRPRSSPLSEQMEDDDDHHPDGDVQDLSSRATTARGPRRGVPLQEQPLDLAMQPMDLSMKATPMLRGSGSARRTSSPPPPPVTAGGPMDLSSSSSRLSAPSFASTPRGVMTSTPEVAIRGPMQLTNHQQRRSFLPFRKTPHLNLGVSGANKMTGPQLLAPRPVADKSLGSALPDPLSVIMTSKIVVGVTAPSSSSSRRFRHSSSGIAPVGGRSDSPVMSIQSTPLPAASGSSTSLLKSSSAAGFDSSRRPSESSRFQSSGGSSSGGNSSSAGRLVGKGFANAGAHPRGSQIASVVSGILLKKQKQRRYRTERPFTCAHCASGFTLRSNMERHIKQQHPEFWATKSRGNGGRTKVGSTDGSPVPSHSSTGPASHSLNLSPIPTSNSASIQHWMAMQTSPTPTVVASGVAFPDMTLSYLGLSDRRQQHRSTVSPAHQHSRLQPTSPPILSPPLLSIPAVKTTMASEAVSRTSAAPTTTTTTISSEVRLAISQQIKQRQSSDTASPASSVPKIMPDLTPSTIRVRQTKFPPSTSGDPTATTDDSNHPPIRRHATPTVPSPASAKKFTSGGGRALDDGEDALVGEDLASVSKLLDTASQQSIQEMFRRPGTDEDDAEDKCDAAPIAVVARSAANKTNTSQSNLNVSSPVARSATVAVPETKALENVEIAEQVPAKETVAVPLPATLPVVLKSVVPLPTPQKSPDRSAKEGARRSAYINAPNRVTCPHCHRQFPWTSSLRRHILTHTGQKPFKCPRCPLWFTTKSNCDRHLTRKHGGGVAESVATSDTEVTVSPVKSTLASPTAPTTGDCTARNAPDRPYRCQLCLSSTFATPENLHKHLQSKHPAQPNKPVSGAAAVSAAATTASGSSSSAGASVSVKQEPQSELGSASSGSDHYWGESEESGEDPMPECPPGVAAAHGAGQAPYFFCLYCLKSFAKHSDCLAHMEERHAHEYSELQSSGRGASAENPSPDKNATAGKDAD